MIESFGLVAEWSRVVNGVVERLGLEIVTYVLAEMLSRDIYVEVSTCGNTGSLGARHSHSCSPSCMSLILLPFPRGNRLHHSRHLIPQAIFLVPTMPAHSM